MKKFMKHILLLAIGFATLVGNATELTSFFNEEDGKTTLLFDNLLQGDQLLVKDIYGITLFKENILKSGYYNKSFDLTTLPDGDYVFELDKKNQIRTYPFTVASNTVTFNKEELTVVVKPRVKAEKNVIYMTASNQDNKAYNVEIFYSNSKILEEKIYSETAKEIGKKIKLLENKKGEYKVVIKTSGRTFTYTINI